MFNLKTLKLDSLIIKKLIYLYIFFSILEGCFRKWLFPNFYNIIFFLKDFFLLFIYIAAINNKYLLKNKIEIITYVIVFLISVYGLIGFYQNLNSINDIFFSFILGVRTYWIYLPLVFLIYNLFKIEDFHKFNKINLYLVFPYFFLILLQTISSPASIINSGFNSLVMNPERPSGFFTYTTQNVYYLIFLYVCFQCYFLFNKILSKQYLFYILILNFSLISISILLKGRVVYAFFFLIFLTSLISTFFLKENKIQKIKKFLIIFVSTIFFFIVSSKVLFHEQFIFSKNRINTDTYKEMLFVKKFKNQKFFSLNIYEFCEKNSSICRIIDVLYFSLENINLFGQGIGSGSSTVSVYLGKNKLYLGENENHRLIAEIGYLGVLLIFFKYFFVTFMSIIFLKRRDFRIAPLLIFVCALTLLLNFTYSTSIISLIYWFCVGNLFVFFRKEIVRS